MISIIYQLLIEYKIDFLDYVIFKWYSGQPYIWYM